MLNFPEKTCEMRKSGFSHLLVKFSDCLRAKALAVRFIKFK